ncbi:MAG: aldehyde dehydrogenase EutE [Deltaproteobacteria bacterium]|nr:aldehyde dehydrogenase EutE [Deltaproteobacteria bacterium]
MADLNASEIQAIVNKVVQRIGGPTSGTASTAKSTLEGARASGRGLFADVDSAVAAARHAFEVFATVPLETRKRMIANVRRRCTEAVDLMSKMAVEETGLGRVNDKVSKNLLVINKTPGPEILEPKVYTGDHGLCLTEFAPYGTFGVITPCTNPTETVINNGIGMLSAGNTAVFNFHPSAKKVSALCISLINDAIVEAGGPENTLTAVAEPTIASAQALMKHPNVRLLCVTGGPAVVRVAMNSGKKTIAAGPGNPPCVVDETADIEAAGRGIVAGASFDNNIVCIVEKEVFVVDSVANQLIAAMQKNGAVLIKGHQIRRLEQLILMDDREHIHKKYVGQSAHVFLDALGIPYDGDPRLVICEVPADHPFVQVEMLTAILPITRVADVDAGIAAAVQAEHGFGHTATMWSKNIDNLHKMARVINTSIFVKNAPAYAGLANGGEGYTSFTIASPTGEGLTTALSFSRQRRCTLKGHFRIV